jgi:hypothetical protein
MLAVLLELLQSTPKEQHYLCGRWSSELLAAELRRITYIEAHASTICRWLNQLNYRYRPARPTLCIRGPKRPSECRRLSARWSTKSRPHSGENQKRYQA